MKAEIVIGTAMAIVGIVAAFCGNPGHLIVSTLPGVGLAAAAYAEQRRDNRRADTYRNDPRLNRNSHKLKS